MEYIGVITGDIVESGEIDPKSRELLYSDLKKFLASLKKENWINEYELFRGDSFQCVQRKKENVLRVAIMIRAFIKSYIILNERDNSKKERDNSKKEKPNISPRGSFRAPRISGYQLALVKLISIIKKVLLILMEKHLD